MLTMQDSVDVANLLPGADAYAGYVGGSFATWPALVKRFGKVPGVALLSIAVNAGENAECLDVETGDAVPADAPGWGARQKARGIAVPVFYASASVMAAVVASLKGAGWSRSQYRLWSAHYGHGPHICGPGSCGQMSLDADGTQWTDAFAGSGGAHIDASELLAGFFGGTAVSVTGPEKWDAKDWAAIDAHADTEPYRDTGPRVMLWWMAAAFAGAKSDSFSPAEQANVTAVSQALSAAIRAELGTIVTGGGGMTAAQIEAAVTTAVQGALAKVFVGA
jgi:hypothetical protein